MAISITFGVFIFGNTCLQHEIFYMQGSLGILIGGVQSGVEIEGVC